jgi:dTMP kinase
MGSNETDGPHARPTSGFFVVLDGPDGGGKTTQAATLVDWLRGRGRVVTSCRDPGGTALGDRVRSLLLERTSVAMGLRAEMLLYMASRAQLVEEVIRPALARGDVVVSDRFLLANIVYQGHAGGLGMAEVGRVGAAATGGLLPDLTILLDLPTSLARVRVGTSRDRIEDRPAAYHERVREGFRLAAENARNGTCGYYPGAVALIDASAEPDVVAERIRSEVERALALDSRS